MTKHIIAVLALLASFVANATICNPTCDQPAPEQGEKEVDLRLSNETNDTVMTKLRIQGSPYSNTNVRIGLYQITTGVNDKVVDAFCVDPFQPASYSDSKYIESKLDWSDFSSNGKEKMALAQSLYDNAYGSLATATNAVKAGFNIALWEIFYDDLEETTGNIEASETQVCVSRNWRGCKKWETKITTNKDVLKAADTFLSALIDNKWKITNTYDLTFYKSVCNQDFLVAKLNPPSQIPVPAALPLFISGLVGFGLIRRRKSA